MPFYPFDANSRFISFHSKVSTTLIIRFLFLNVTNFLSKAIFFRCQFDIKTQIIRQNLIIGAWQYNRDSLCAVKRVLFYMICSLHISQAQK